jgi:NAD(P)H-hydrate epimerase
MKLLTVKQSRELDSIAINEKGIPGIDLMGKAGSIVADYAQKMISNISNPKIAIICGKGNNAGDGYKAALDLSIGGFHVDIFLVFKKDTIAGDAEHYFKLCVSKKLSINDISNFKNENYDLIVDAILGTGFTGEIKEPIRSITKQINDSNALVLAIDVPSGVDANNGLAADNAIVADLTVTMGYIKVGMLIQPANLHCGELICADIGFPDIYDDLSGIKYRTSEEEFAFEYLAAPNVSTYKHKQGKVLIVAGSRGMTGAAILASKAAIISGAGLVHSVAPKSINSIYESNIIEGLTIVTEDDDSGYLSINNFADIEKYFDWADALLIGPGLGNNEYTLELMEKIITTFKKPMVIDADALNILSNNKDLLNTAPSNKIITPHFGEFGRIINKNMVEIKENILEYIETFTNNHNCTLVAKNAPTIISNENDIVINTTGNQGMATGGTGDVLSGIIASLLAQGIEARIAAELGVFIHGKAADLVKKEKGLRGLIATDIIDYLPTVMKEYE